MPRLNCIDLSLERDGKEFAYPHQEGIRVRLARLNHPAMLAWQGSPEGQDRLRELLLKHAEGEARRLFFLESVGRHVVRGWTGIDADDGSGPQGFDEEVSVGWMTDPRRHQWSTWVIWQSDQMAEYLEADASSAAKNSAAA